MLLTHLASLALPIIGATAAPVVGSLDAAPVQKRGDIFDIVTDLQTQIVSLARSSSHCSNQS